MNFSGIDYHGAELTVRSVKVKGLIIIPKYLENRHTDNWRILLRMVADSFGFDLQFTDNPEIPKNVDIVITHCVPLYGRPSYGIMNELLKLDKNVKIVGYIRDSQCYGDPVCKDVIRIMFDRYDLILAQADEMFKRLYPQYLHKYIYFRQFFASHERYVSLGFNRDPEMKCLLCGAVDSEIYPIRMHVFKYGDKEKIDCILPIIGEGVHFIKEKYAWLLYHYYCSVTCSSIFNMALAKHVEIPAAGSLLICNQTKDLDLMGMIPWKYYVPITQENVLDQAYECLSRIDKYNQIRINAQEFVHENHSVRNRFGEFKQIIEGVLSDD